LLSLAGGYGSVRLNLNAGLDKALRKNEEETGKEGLSNLLRWILINKHKFSASPSPSATPRNTDFVCYRGCLTTLASSPFEGRDGWTVTAVRWRGTIFINKEETREQREQKARTTDRQRAMMSWGYKFEQFMLADQPYGDPKTDEAVNEAEEFCCVFRTRLGKHSVVYGAEMDGVNVPNEASSSSSSSSSSPFANPSSLDLEKVDFVELKTSRQLDHPGQERTFRRCKLIKWWLQSFLVGIPTVVAGFRDDSGVVHEVCEYPVKEIPRQCGDHWQPNVCMNFLSEALAHVKVRF